MSHLKSGALCRELGLQHYVLQYMLKIGEIPEPERDSSGQRCWSPADVRRLRAVLAKRRGGKTPTPAA
jgi:DNA-binding transcriptional MerR regulator